VGIAERTISLDAIDVCSDVAGSSLISEVTAFTDVKLDETFGHAAQFVARGSGEAGYTGFKNGLASLSSIAIVVAYRSLEYHTQDFFKDAIEFSEKQTDILLLHIIHIRKVRAKGVRYSRRETKSIHLRT
jgi:hypothetical protein